MCGIAGAVALGPDARPDPERVRRMSCLIAHRGPDGEGLWTSPSGRACLAHRRLSIIDLATGAQPMVAPDGESALVFNGEIYNYVELRRELADSGVALRTESDTEALQHLLAREGADALHRVRGMFAFAHWDDRAGRLILARDRVGKKPMFHAESDGCLYFASSLRALRAALPRARAVSVQALDAYLTLGYVPAPLTIHEGVHKLPAATVVEMDVTGRRRERVFWDLSDDDRRFEGTEDEALEALDAVLDEAVTLRLRSDVPLGVFLSGGIDSSLIAALAARRAPGVRTFSIAMDDAAFDESGYAAEVARRLGTEHHVFRAVPDLLGTLPEMVDHFGEPYADSSALPTWLLARETRRFVTVALGGDGGDEAFGGYNWYATAARLAQLTRVVPSRAYAMAGGALAGLSRTGLPLPTPMGRAERGFAMLGVPAGARRFAALRSQLNRSDARRLFAGPLAAQRAAGRTPGADLLRETYERTRGSELRRMRWTDIRTYLADELLPKVDVATMAHGVEARAPLLDQEVVRFALSLPDSMLVGPGGGKLILRRLLERHVPRELFDRPKQGFSIPLSRWFNGAASGRMAGLATSERLLDSGWFRRDGLAALVREHASGRRDHADRLFTLLVLDEWLRAQ